MGKKGQKRSFEDVNCGEVSAGGAMGGNHKRPRVRSLHSSLCTNQLSILLTFWLSAANLTKDKFLVREMAKNNEGWMAVAIFQKFNKVIALKATLNDLVIALSTAKLPHIEMRISSNEEPRFRFEGGLDALQIFLQDASNTEDQRTIYVETLPNVVSRDQIVEHFGRFGKVCYVSIPRFADGRCKGFSFVEFETEEDANRVVCASKGKTLKSEQFPDISAIPRSEWRQKKEKYNDIKRARRVAMNKAKKKSDSRRVNGTTTTHDEGGSNNAQGSASVDTMKMGKEAAGSIQECMNSVQKPAFVSGLLVSVSSLEHASTKVSRRGLYKDLEEHGPLSYIDYSPKTPYSCIARYMHESGAKRAVESLTAADGANVLGAVVKAEVLSGSKEAEYWDMVEQRRKEKQERRLNKEEESKNRRVSERQQPCRVKRTGAKRKGKKSGKHGSGK